jgi:hypothetical protein
MRLAGICVCVAVVTLAESASWSQGNPVGAAPRAPIGHRQPAIRNLPPDVGQGPDRDGSEPLTQADVPRDPLQ